LLLLCVLQCPSGSAVHTVCVDLLDWQKTQSVVQSLGNIDLLVNNAGVGIIEPFLSVTPDSYDRHVASLFSFSKCISKMSDYIEHINVGCQNDCWRLKVLFTLVLWKEKCLK